jgi:hypothetical protein
MPAAIAASAQAAMNFIPTSREYPRCASAPKSRAL